MIFYWIALSAALLGAGAVQNSDLGYIYDEQGTNTSEVFNLQTRLFSIQPRRSASLTKSSEFSGGFEICSTAQVHCLSGPLNLVIPKNLVEGRWEHGNTVCLTKSDGAGKIRGACTSNSVEVDYVFEAESGLVSYRLRVKDTGGGYRDQGLRQIRGKKGLFSSVLIYSAPAHPAK